jgi:hypothetical protein
MERCSGLFVCGGGGAVWTWTTVGQLVSTWRSQGPAQYGPQQEGLLCFDLALPKTARSPRLLSSLSASLSSSNIEVLIGTHSNRCWDGKKSWKENNMKDIVKGCELIANHRRGPGKAQRDNDWGACSGGPENRAVKGRVVDAWGHVDTQPNNETNILRVSLSYLVLSRFYFFVMMKIKPRASHILGRCSTTESRCQSH